MTPLPPDRIRDALADLDAITARKKAEDLDLTLITRCYAQRLAKYPADIVLHVIAEWDAKWWPEWADLQAKLEEHMIPRRALLHRLKRVEKEHGTRKKAEAIGPPTKAEKAAIQAEVNAFLAGRKSSRAPEFAGSDAS